MVSRMANFVFYNVIGYFPVSIRQLPGVVVEKEKEVQRIMQLNSGGCLFFLLSD